MKKTVLSLGLLVLVGLAARLGAAAYSGTLTATPKSYYVHLEEGKVPEWVGRHTTAHGSGYQYAYAFLFRLAGLRESRFGVLLCLLGAMMPLMVLGLSRRLLPASARGAPTLAAWTAALLPPLMMLSATWWYALIPVMLSLLHLLVVVGPVDRPRRWTAWASFTGSLLVLTRPDYYPAGVFVALARRAPWRHRIAAVSIPVLFLLAHNVALSETPRLWDGNMWSNLDSNYNRLVRNALIGYGPDHWTTELAMADDMSPEERSGIHLRGDELNKKRVLRFIFEHPDLLAEAVVMKILKLFDVKRDGAIIQSPVENISYTLPLLALLLGAAAGFGLLLRDPDSGPLPLWMVLAFLGYALPMVGLASLDRTRVPLHIFWIVLAAYAVVTCWRMVRKSGGGQGGSAGDKAPVPGAQGLSGNNLANRPCSGP